MIRIDSYHGKLPGRFVCDGLVGDLPAQMLATLMRENRNLGAVTVTRYAFAIMTPDEVDGLRREAKSLDVHLNEDTPPATQPAPIPQPLLSDKDHREHYQTTLTMLKAARELLTRAATSMAAVHYLYGVTSLDGMNGQIDCMGQHIARVLKADTEGGEG